jgi:hypothetical protein
MRSGRIFSDRRLHFHKYGEYNRSMPTKDQTAQLLADAHFRLDQGITRIFRIIEPDESANSKSVKLLEVNPMTTEVGIQPVGLSADPSRQIFYACTIVEISPNEFDRLQRGELKLPHGWRLGEELMPHAPTAGSAT